MTRYTVRYRSSGSRPVAMIVEDEQGVAHLFSGGHLQGRLAGLGASARLARLLEHHLTWSPVPEVAAHSLEHLRLLAGAAPESLGLAASTSVGKARNPDA